MEWAPALLLLLGTLIALMVTGLPVAFAFLGVNIVGAIVFLGGDIGLDQMVRNTVASVSNFSLAPIPLFLIMMLAGMAGALGMVCLKKAMAGGA